jgi:hypothetical protein
MSTPCRAKQRSSSGIPVSCTIKSRSSLESDSDNCERSQWDTSPRACCLPRRATLRGGRVRARERPDLFLIFLDIVARPFEKQSFRCGRLTLVYAFCWPIEDGRSIRPLRGYFTPHFMKPLSAWLFAMLSTPDYSNSVGDLATPIGNDEKSDQLWSRKYRFSLRRSPGELHRSERRQSKHCGGDAMRQPIRQPRAILSCACAANSRAEWQHLSGTAVDDSS